MSSERARLLEDLEEAREDGDEHLVAQTLYRLAMITPLFSARLSEVREWTREGCDLAVRSVLPPRQEVGQVLRSAEVFLAGGASREAFRLAHEACDMAARHDLPGLEDRAWMVSARSLVRLGRQDDAVELFEKIGGREVDSDQEDPVVPGLAFLSMGEAHLFEGRYDGAYAPLERAVGLLPGESGDAKLRYDALVGLGMLDHRSGSFDTAALRYRAALQLADSQSSPAEQVETLLLMGSLVRGQGQIEQAHTCLKRALKLSVNLTPPHKDLEFPTERLLNLVGLGTAQDMIDSAVDLARDCGSKGDLMGYVQLTAIVAALIDLDGRNAEACEMLGQVASGLAEGGQTLAAGVLRQHLSAYQG